MRDSHRAFLRRLQPSRRYFVMTVLSSFPIAMGAATLNANAEGNTPPSAKEVNKSLSNGSMDWLVGEWSIEGVDRTIHFSWTRSDDGLRGQVDYVDGDRKRILSSVWTISEKNGTLALSIHRIVEASIAGLLSSQVIERLADRGVDHQWPVYPKAKPNSHRKRSHAYKGSIIDSSVIVFNSIDKASIYIDDQFPVSLRLRRAGERLVVVEDHGNKKFKKGDEFVLSKIGSSRPAPPL